MIMPGSVGWIVVDHDQELLIDGVFFTPKEELKYKGRRVEDSVRGNVVSYFPVSSVRPIPGVSKLGLYDMETAELVPIQPEDI